MLPRFIVSCQARDDNPLTGAIFMRAMALAAIQGGADGIRANGIEDIRAIREALPNTPVIGLIKKDLPDFPVYITPDLESVHEVIAAGADYVALDVTHRSRPVPLEAMFAAIHSAGKKVFADCATLLDATRAANLGADLVSSTMAGYTPETAASKTENPDFALLEQMLQAVHIPVIAEGRFWTPEEVQKAYQLGVAGVVVGTAITNPREIVRRFISKLG
ncbi:MAG: N-acetylmannosamine-6-phosphate 2-epimerase [Deinococcales bacterium]